MLKRFVSAASVLLCLSFPAWSAPGHHEAPQIPKELEDMKKLAGTWEATMKMGDKEEKIAVVYEVTSGGTVVLAKLMPGTPHEMISIYHKEGKTLAMTHYCSAGNQPHMVLKKSDGKVFAFEMPKGEKLGSSKEGHMHAVTLTLADPDTLKEEWIGYEGGKQNDTKVFNFKRVK